MKTIPYTPPREVLNTLQMPLSDKNTYDIIKKIIMIAEHECQTDQRAKAIIADMFAVTIDRISAVLNKMMELDLIETIDAKLFASVLVRFGMSAALRVENLQNLSVTEWQAGRQLLFSLVRPKNQAK
jgi:hypothetical protein